MAERGEVGPGIGGRAGVGAFAAALRTRLFRIAPAAARAIRESWVAELDERRGFHWLAAAFGTGAIVYFALPREPSLAAVAAAAALVSILALSAFHRDRPFRALTLVALLLLGATAAKIRTDSLGGPAITRQAAALVTGRVLQVEERVERRPRILLDRLAIAGRAPGETPARLRLSLPPGRPLPPLGAAIEVRAMLMPVPGPSMPGGYNPRWSAFFDGIGGSGFALGNWTLLPEPDGPGWRFLVAKVRRHVVDRIRSLAPGEAGAVAAALLVGERSGLSDATKRNLQDSGLAHVISISGLHMMLVAGTAFFAVRALLALSPALALGRPIRQWAAIVAIGVATAYLAISGGNVATRRAYVMAAILFAAVLAGRPALSMRNLAIAAFVVLALEPESVLEPGFQMSFAAVVALVAGWEAWRDREPGIAGEPLFPGHAALRWLWRGVFGIALTTVIASLATAPYAAYHFERITSFALVANLLAMPVVSILVMPFGLLALLLMPFGLDPLPLAVMTTGIELMLAVAGWVARLPGASLPSPPIPAAALIVMTAGFLWLALWRLRWRLAGVPVAILGLLMVPVFGGRPDVVLSPDGRVAAVRDETGVLRVSGGRAGSFTVEQLFESEPGMPSRAELRAGMACDEAACLLRGAGGRLVSHVRDAVAFAEDCRRAAVVLTPLPAPPGCAAAIVIDRDRLARFGAHAIAFPGGPDGAPVVATAHGDMKRPWQ
ncbi:ComEC/Rec2 family competence protein [Faunimonas sp. B44]|uniref:ComEC/Rec2 family competence protein n=1 Tax=Faunimonas sp. B44 TaxID=3461493 RepID=UPI0040440E9B